MKRDIEFLIAQGEIKAACVLIRKAIDQGVDLGQMKVQAAHIMLQGADWDAIDRLLPTNTNAFRTTGMLNSIVSGRPINADNEPVPWFTYPAIDFLDDLVRPWWKVFEWGSGNSTLWWCSRVASVTSIEDSSNWHEEVCRQVRNPNSEILFRQGDAYSQAINAYPDRHFDVIVVDGSIRNACAKAAVPKLKPDGLLLFDNADGKEFDSGQDFLTQQGFLRIDFWGLIPSYLYKNCTSVHFRDPAFLLRGARPSAHRSSIGASCFQAIETSLAQREPITASS